MYDSRLLSVNYYIYVFYAESMQIDSSIGNWKWSSAEYWIGYLKSVQNETRRCFSSFIFDISKNKNGRLIFWRNWPIIASSFDNQFFVKTSFSVFFWTNTGTDLDRSPTQKRCSKHFDWFSVEQRKKNPFSLTFDDFHTIHAWKYSFKKIN